MWDCGLTKDKIIEITAVVQNTHWFLLNARLKTDMIRKSAAALAEEMLFVISSPIYTRRPRQKKKKKKLIGNEPTLLTVQHTTEDLAFPTLRVCVSPWLEAVSVLSGVSQCRQMRSHYASLPQG